MVKLLIIGKWIRSGCSAVAFFTAALVFLAADKAGEIPLLPDLPE